ncbi:MAG: hypothetical protein Fur0016_00250 [Anaerolineales bacterium]
MQKDILSNFFGKLMPMFPPRSEAFLKSATREDLQRVNFRYIFTVNGMTEISHMIEDAVIVSPGVSSTHVSFQYFSRVADQAERYTRVAQASTGLWLYGVPDAPLPEFAHTVAVDTTGTPLENYWFVIAYGPAIHMTLLAEEVNPVDRLPAEPRMYEGFYTFDHNFAFKVLTVLHKLFPEQVGEPTLPELLE